MTTSDRDPLPPTLDPRAPVVARDEEVSTLPSSPDSGGSGARTRPRNPRDSLEFHPAFDPSQPGSRYEDRGLLAQGATGEVRRVWDRDMERESAVKILHEELKDQGALRNRFEIEARMTAALEHPGIVPVYERGETADGRPWFAMKEVRGRTLGRVIDDLHAGAGGWTLWRAVETVRRVCEVVGYAHSRGVLHRDLKPANIMVGAFGEVLVMDWGLAKALGDEGATGEAGPPLPEVPDALATRVGAIAGTPGYMAPEQARGETALTAAADVYALGSILYEVLSGRSPYSGSGRGVLKQVLEGGPRDIDEVLGDLQGPESGVRGPGSVLRIPAELRGITRRAMAREPGERYPDAGALTDAIDAWLDGARRRDEARAMLAEARELEPEAARLRELAEERREEARRILEPLEPWAPTEAKEPAWALEDEAAALEQKAVLAETRRLQQAHAALNLDPDLDEARALIADHYQARLAEAEAARNAVAATRNEALLRAWAQPRHRAFLKGLGALTLVTEPAGAEVTLVRFEEERRRLVPKRVRELGPTPIVELSLKQGSYLLEIRAQGRAAVRYPVRIDRGGHWDGARPGDAAPYPIPLPEIDSLRDGEIYIPAGPFTAGGDPDAADSLPRRSVWVDGFVMARHPVTVAEYADFLNDLLERGQEAEALRQAPAPRLGSPEGTPAGLVRDASGRFVPGPDDAGVEWQADWPITQVDWRQARAYVDWLAARRGVRLRLPMSLEWEKAARGVDARFCPWGDVVEPTWACVLNSRRGKPSRAGVSEYAADESPYGIRGMAGNVRDWCLDGWMRRGPEIRDGVLVVNGDAEFEPDLLEIRGGAWTNVHRFCRSATRFAGRPEQRFVTVGFRWCRGVAR